jgi:hypothetical protein
MMEAPIIIYRLYWRLGKYDESTLKRISTSASVKVTGTLIPSWERVKKAK